jgi:hypothetical protein
MPTAAPERRLPVLNEVTPVAYADLAACRTLVLAGGGNRCWWQAGVLSRLRDLGWASPRSVLGTSAGAAMGFAMLTDGIEAALHACQRLYAANSRLLHMALRPRPRIWFAHRHIYPAWIDALATSERQQLLHRSGARLFVALSRPAIGLGLGGSVALGAAAYALAKHVRGELHPTLPRLLGLQQDIVEILPSMSPTQVRALMEATAAALPFMRPHRIGAGWAMDGGYTDHVALPHPPEKQPHRTLVLLTRWHGKLPRLFRYRDRLYWQPLGRVPVSTWDCRPCTDVLPAYRLGIRDVDDLLARGFISVSDSAANGRRRL